MCPYRSIALDLCVKRPFLSVALLIRPCKFQAILRSSKICDCSRIRHLVYEHCLIYSVALYTSIAYEHRLIYRASPYLRASPYIRAPLLTVFFCLKANEFQPYEVKIGFYNSFESNCSLFVCRIRSPTGLDANVSLLSSLSALFPVKN